MTYYKSSTQEADRKSRVCREALHTQGIHDLDKKKCFTTMLPKAPIQELGEVEEDQSWVVFILD